MRIISSCKMGPGTFEAKFIPLSKLQLVEKIYILREYTGPEIDKVVYLILPASVRKFRICKIAVPLYLAYYTRKYKCDLIIGYHFIPHVFFAYIASILTQVPFACAQTGLDIQRFAKAPIFKSFLKRIINKASFLNVPGTMSKVFWKGFGIDGEKIYALHSTIDTKIWVPDKIIEKRYDFIILGRLVAVKRVELILKGFKLLISFRPEIQKPKLLIVGTGVDERKLIKLVKELDIDDYVRFAGFVSNPLNLLQQSKFIVMSSISEGLPTAMMQAMACGLIPITNLVGNIPDLVADSLTGIVHNGTDPMNICEKMNIALNLDRQVLLKMQNAAREIIVYNHSHDSAIKKWERVISKI